MLWGKMFISTFPASTLDVSRHTFMGIMGEPDHLERSGCFLCVYWVMVHLIATGKTQLNGFWQVRGS